MTHYSLFSHKNFPFFLRKLTIYRRRNANTKKPIRSVVEYIKKCEYKKSITATTKDATSKSSDPEYFSYSKMIASVANIKSAVNPKFVTRIASIIKLRINTPISIGIFLIRTTNVAPIKKTKGKLITVVSRIIATILNNITRIINW
jgi:hypothetical protein